VSVDIRRRLHAARRLPLVADYSFDYDYSPLICRQRRYAAPRDAAQARENARAVSPRMSMAVTRERVQRQQARDE